MRFVLLIISISFKGASQVQRGRFIAGLGLAGVTGCAGSAGSLGESANGPLDGPILAGIPVLPKPVPHTGALEIHK